MATKKPETEPDLDLEQIRTKAEEIRQQCIEIRKNKTVSLYSEGDKKEEYERLRNLRRGMLWAIGDIEDLNGNKPSYSMPETPDREEMVPLIRATRKWHIPRGESKQKTIEQFVSGADTASSVSYCSVPVDGIIAMADINENVGRICENCIKSYNREKDR